MDAIAEGALEEAREPGQPFGQYVVAGAAAGICEHVCVFPLDSVKTHVQSSGAGSLATAGKLVRTRGLGFLWRGVGTTFALCGPAHAMMFTAYECVLEAGGARRPDAPIERVAAVGLAAGAISNLFHDAVMVPAETVKQRLQLGYYRGAAHGLRRMVDNGGRSLWRSLPTTFLMNAPYASVMMMCNESLRRCVPGGELGIGAVLACGAVSGAVAGAATTPLDAIKTRLQVQSLKAQSRAHVSQSPEAFVVRYEGLADAAAYCYRHHGLAGFWRGLGPRTAMMGASCAISWGAYESFKKAYDRVWR
jgi:solute carrier family 25 iron transporter 28/37